MSLRDHLFLLGDERIEPRDLDGVVALLVLAEAEQIGVVLRPPAVEEEVVLAVDRGAERLRLIQVRDVRRATPAFGQSANLMMITFVPSILSFVRIPGARSLSSVRGIT